MSQAEPNFFLHFHHHSTWQYRVHLRLTSKADLPHSGAVGINQWG